MVDILEQNREQLLTLAGREENHHAFVSGYLEHVLNVTRTCCHLADKYAELYRDLEPPLNKDVDRRRRRAARHRQAARADRDAGRGRIHGRRQLIGHVLQGRDIVREAAAGREIDPETLLRLEHVIVAHQRLPGVGLARSRR